MPTSTTLSGYSICPIQIQFDSETDFRFGEESTQFMNLKPDSDLWNLFESHFTCKPCPLIYAIRLPSKSEYQFHCKAESMHTHTHNRFTSSGILSGTTRVSWHQKGKTNLDLLQQEIVSGSESNIPLECTTNSNKKNNINMSLMASFVAIFLPAIFSSYELHYCHVLLPLGSCSINIRLSCPALQLH